MVALVAAALFGWSTRRWRRETRALRARLESVRIPAKPPAVDFGELAGLPPPVERYLRLVLEDGQPIIAAAHLRHRGSFDLGREGPRWAPFTSEQWVAVRPPGFVWDARIRAAPGVPVHVHDAYAAGHGVLRARLFGGLTLMEQPAGPELDRGELVRFLAEAAWYPTALLPGQGVRWQAVDDRRARATLADGEIAVSLLFEFGADGLLAAVQADARARSVGGTMVPTPWRGRFWGYATRAGVRVPLHGEVAWLPPEGPRPYWRGEMVAIDYEFARCAEPHSSVK